MAGCPLGGRLVLPGIPMGCCAVLLYPRPTDRYSSGFQETKKLGVPEKRLYRGLFSGTPTSESDLQGVRHSDPVNALHRGDRFTANVTIERSGAQKKTAFWKSFFAVYIY